MTKDASAADEIWIRCLDSLQSQVVVTQDIANLRATVAQKSLLKATDGRRLSAYNVVRYVQIHDVATGTNTTPSTVRYELGMRVAAIKGTPMDLCWFRSLHY